MTLQCQQSSRVSRGGAEFSHSPFIFIMVTYSHYVPSCRGWLLVIISLQLSQS